MEIFKKNKNILFRIMTRILNESIMDNKVFSMKDVRSLLEKNEYYDPTDVALRSFIDHFTDESGSRRIGFGLMMPAQGGYESALSGKVPVRPSFDELMWLRSMMDDYRINRNSRKSFYHHSRDTISSEEVRYSNALRFH